MACSAGPEPSRVDLRNLKSPPAKCGDHPPDGDGTLRGLRSRGPIAVSASIISLFGLRLGVGSGRAAMDSAPGAGSAAGSAFISIQVCAPNRLSRHHCLENGNRALYLFVLHLFDRIAMLELVLSREQ
jgi:hypothetical protein